MDENIAMPSCFDARFDARERPGRARMIKSRKDRAKATAVRNTGGHNL
jgi:hypothetical protein